MLNFPAKGGRWIVLAFALVALAFVAACGGPTQPASDTPTALTGATPTASGVEVPPINPTEQGRRAGGPLVVYTSRSEALIKPVIDAFEKQFEGVEVKLLSGRVGELGAKLLEERSRPQADVYINTDLLNMASLAQEGVFEPMDYPPVTNVPQEYRADDNTWVALTLRARVIMYNTNLVQAEELPSSVFDLTDPKWKGQVGSSDSTNGAMQAHIAAIRKLQGEKKAEEFVRGLVENDTKFFGGHTEVRKAVGVGELKLGLVNHYYYQLSRAEGAPVGVIYPDQGDGEMGVVVNSTNAAIVKGGSNPVVARAFVEYLLMADGQKIFADLNYEYPVMPDVEPVEGVAPIDSFRRAGMSFKEMWQDLVPTKELIQRAGMP